MPRFYSLGLRTSVSEHMKKLPIFNIKYSITKMRKVSFALFKGHKVNSLLNGFILNRQVVHHHVDPRRRAV